MKKTIVLTFLSALVLLAPSLVMAEVSAVSAQQGLTTFGTLITTFNNTIIKALGTLFMSASVVAFFYGIVQYVWGIRDGKLEAINAGKEFMIWALVALFVMFSVYGIIKFFQKIVPGLDSASITIPNVIFQGGGGGTAVPAANGGVDPRGTAVPPANGGVNPNGGVAVPEANGGNNPSAYDGGSVAPAANGGALKADGEQCTFSAQCSSGYCQSGPYGSQCAIPLP